MSYNSEKLKILSNEITRLFMEMELYENIINSIENKKKECGALFLVGKSGKIGDDSVLMEIKLNDIGACVDVPALVLKLAKNKLETSEILGTAIVKAKQALEKARMK